MGKKIIIIGGGIIGLSSAYFLQKEGHEVTVIDKSDIASGASFVNAGYITPSHIIPLAAPGMIAQGIKMMFNSASPFYMKPRWNVDLFKWAWYFNKSSTKQKVERAIPVIKDINILSRTLFEEIKQSGDLGDFQLERKGLLMLYKTDASYHHEIEVARKARFLGLEVSEFDQKQLKEIEPHIRIEAKGAIHYECDAHTTPIEIMAKMIDYLNKVGVKIQMNEEVIDVITDGKDIQKVVTSRGNHMADDFVMAAGTWSHGLAKKMNMKLPLEGGKGYSIDVNRPTGITTPAILMESKMAVTPMKGFTRFAGTMEFSGINNTIRQERVRAIAHGAQKYYPDISITEEEMKGAKTGLRPVSPDGLAYIGKSEKYRNLTFATGHAMMGWSLGPATGKLVSEIVAGSKISMDISAFSPDRRF